MVANGSEVSRMLSAVKTLSLALDGVLWVSLGYYGVL